MALGAMAKHNISVNIVCCGINYYACDKFRSRVIIEFGQPYKIPAESAELYKTNKRSAISELLSEIQFVRGGKGTDRPHGTDVTS